MTMATQTTYLPPASLRETVLEVDLDQLPPNEEIIGPDPDRALIESIWTLGQLEPLIVSPTVDGYAVHSGRRRVKALRACLERAGEDAGLRARFGTARAIQLDNAEEVDGYLDLAANQRRPNPVSDLAAIEAVLLRLYGDATDATDDQLKAVAKATGMRLATVRKRYALLGLPTDLRRELYLGKLTVSVAEALARLGPEAQTLATATYWDKGKLTAADLQDARRVGRSAAGLQLDFAADVPARTVSDASQLLAQRLTEDAAATIRQWGGATETHPEGSFGAVLGGTAYRVTVLVEESQGPHV